MRTEKINVNANTNNDIYVVEWHDAHSDSAWLSNNEVEKFIKKEKCICINTGYILSETKDEIVLASRKVKWSIEGDCQWGMLQKIPKTWVLKKRRLK